MASGKETPGRGQDGTFIQTLEGAERDAEVARLRSAGFSFKQIAERVGYANQSSAYKAYKRALAAVPVEAVQELRATSLARLDLATRRVLEVLYRNHLHVAASGRVAVHPATGEMLTDDGPLLAAVDRLVKLEERRARLLGLDSPARVDMTISDEMDQRIKALMAEMGNPVLPDPERAEPLAIEDADRAGDMVAYDGES